MRLIRAVGGVAFLAAVGLALAQQPMPAPLPAINPAAARADGLVGGLDGAGLAVVYLDGRGVLVAACDGGSLCVWGPDAALGVRSAEASAQALEAHVGPVTALVALGDGVASGGADGKVHVWGLDAGKATLTIDAGGPVRALAAAPDGKSLAVAAGDGPVVQLWGADGKAGVKLAGATDWLLAVAFSPDGKQVAAGGFDGRWYLWGADGKKLADAEALAPPPPNTPARPPNPVTALAFAPDGKSLAVGGADGQVLLFGTDGKFVRAMLAGHGSAVSGLAFHPAGAVLASSGKDRVVRLWTPATGAALKALEGHTAWAMGVVFLAKGTRLASVGADQTVRLWDLTEPKK